MRDVRRSGRPPACRRRGPAIPSPPNAAGLQNDAVARYAIRRQSAGLLRIPSNILTADHPATAITFTRFFVPIAGSFAPSHSQRREDSPAVWPRYHRRGFTRRQVAGNDGKPIQVGCFKSRFDPFPDEKRQRPGKRPTTSLDGTYIG